MPRMAAVLVVALLGGVASASATALSAPPPPLPRPSQPAPPLVSTPPIVFDKGPSENRDIWAMSSAGGGLLQLTFDPANDTEPAWSPDGTKIAFVSDRDGNREIYVMSSNGLGVTRITFTDTYEGSPSWSPDGTRIVFETHASGYDAIAHAEAVPHAAFVYVTSCGSAYNPDWRDDGAYIYHEGYTGGKARVFRSSPWNLRLKSCYGNPRTPDPEVGDYAEGPALSPGPAFQLVYTRTENVDDPPIARRLFSKLDTAGTEEWGDGLTEFPKVGQPNESMADWASDGNHIVFVRGINIWKMNPDGSGKTQLEPGSNPDWR